MSGDNNEVYTAQELFDKGYNFFEKNDFENALKYYKLSLS